MGERNREQQLDRREPIVETEDHILFLGARLPKAVKRDGIHVPNQEHYADYVHDAELTLPLQRDIAIAWGSGDPILVEGGYITRENKYSTRDVCSFRV